MSEAVVEVRGNRKERVGVVVSDVQDKTIVVKVGKKFTAHDEKNEAKKGDTVRIVETRPMSKNKCWRLAAVISRPEQE